MDKQLTWLGHNCWQIRLGNSVLVVDPFLPDSAPVRFDQVEADFLLVSHGHADHCAQAVDIARRTGATIVAMAEPAGWFNQKKVSRTEPMNIGGTIPLKIDSGEEGLSEIYVTMTPALHSSTMPDGSSGGNSCGFLVSIPKAPWNRGAIVPFCERAADSCNLYFACDTGWFSEMEYIGSLGLELAVLPIGDRYTFGPEMSLDAIRALRPKRVIPTHYGTWAPIAQDPRLWAEAVKKYTEAEPVVLRPGEPFSW
ncbi:MAG: metal-dependent hydrolase [Thermoguttaceae bacterium]|nr:metal-dependent hydrolase [Thermoguttaceae bacterium]MBR2586450.1 metal-dependent hydrolase [Thermoguttaceae bacterium]